MIDWKNQAQTDFYVGVLADLSKERVELKAFDCEMLTDYDAINKEEAAYKRTPIIRQTGR